jgi:hypothetical protein
MIRFAKIASISFEDPAVLAGDEGASRAPEREESSQSSITQLASLAFGYKYEALRQKWKQSETGAQPCAPVQTDRGTHQSASESQYAGTGGGECGQIYGLVFRGKDDRAAIHHRAAKDAPSQGAN